MKPLKIYKSSQGNYLVIRDGSAQAFKEQSITEDFFLIFATKSYESLLAFLPELNDPSASNWIKGLLKNE